MEFEQLSDAIGLLEKANANLEPDLLPADGARELLAAYARVERLASFGVAVLAPRVDDAGALARVTGTSVGKANQTVETGTSLRAAPDLTDALREGEISFDQAAEIAKAEEVRPGAPTPTATISA